MLWLLGCNLRMSLTWQIHLLMTEKAAQNYRALIRRIKKKK